MNVDETRRIVEEHLGQSTELELISPSGKKNTFKLSPISPEKIPKLYETMRILKNVEKNPTSAIENIDEKWLEEIAEIGLECLKPNYPGIPDEKLKELVKRNAINFANAIWSKNLGLSMESKKLQRIEGKIIRK